MNLRINVNIISAWKKYQPNAKFIFVYVLSLPFALIDDFGYWTIPVSGFVLFVLASLELLAEEIEDPFGSDSNDLPTLEMSHTIKANLLAIYELD